MLPKRLTSTRPFPRTLAFFASFSALLAFNASLAVAQDSLLLRDYRFVVQQSPWLGSTNAAALTSYSSDNIAQAEVSLGYGHGQLTGYSMQTTVLQVSADVASYYRITPRTVVYGRMAYDNTSGRNVTGSVFMPVGGLLRPFDIVEDSVNNAGRKHSDVYSLTGGVGVDLWRGYSVGARLDYTSGNYAKYKDLRHKNSLMDLQATASAFAPLTDWLSVGASYTYRRRTESLVFSVNGKSEKVYKSLIDYGALMGIVEQFGNEGYTDKSNEMPLFEEGHGGSFQAEVRLLSGLSVFAAFSYAGADGYYGRRSPFTITYTDHDRDLLTLQTRMSYVTPNYRSAHYLDVCYGDQKVHNRANTYRPLKNINGATYYEYYDPVETGDKRERLLTADYTAHWGIDGELPAWTLTAGYHWQRRTQRAYLYPYYRMQQLTVKEFAAGLQRNLRTGQRGVLSLALSAAYRKGSGEPYTDGTFITPDASQQQPATMSEFLMRDYHEMTAPQYRVGLEAKYAFVADALGLRPHVRLALDRRQATNTDYYPDGRHYTQVTVAVGCTF